jgi:hypothetical protein
MSPFLFSSMSGTKGMFSSGIFLRNGTVALYCYSAMSVQS